MEGDVCQLATADAGVPEGDPLIRHSRQPAANQTGKKRMTEWITVKVREDHLRRLAAVKPIAALCELIWNALDADANTVHVRASRNALNHLDRIIVEDDGAGFTIDEARASFGGLGGSWKRHQNRTKGGRLLHGEQGRGRFRAFALGKKVTWRTRHAHAKGARQIMITGHADRLTEFEVSEGEEVGISHIGTIVEIRDIHRNFRIFNEDASGNYIEEFALYLRQYPSVRIEIAGERIDPSRVEKNVADCDLGLIDLADDLSINASLTIIEWTIATNRSLYLCDQDGFTLWKIKPGIRAPGYNFTAYLKSSHLRELDKEGALQLEELEPDLKKILQPAKAKMREYFRNRAAIEAKSLIIQWKEEEVYPYKNDPGNIIEEAERQVFDVVALNVHSLLPDFEEMDAVSKRFSFRLLREAIESDPSSLQNILQDVLGLSREKREELAQLLKRTTLEAIINASKIVADRLDFLEGLELLVFHSKSKQELLERRQLHRIVAEHTWIFGEALNLTASDRSLTTVLKKHLELREKDVLDDSPVTRYDGSRGIIDLMLSRVVPQPNPETREHLIVELKRPSILIGPKEVQQIESYAFAIAGDERFRDGDVRWTFWAVSNDIEEPVRRRANQKGRPPGLLHEELDGSIRIWVKKWGQIIDECKARLRFFQEKLEYQADDESALAYLRRTHEKYLPSALSDLVVEEKGSEQAANGAGSAAEHSSAS